MVKLVDSLTANKEIARKYLEDSSRVTLLVADECLDGIIEMADMLIQAFRAGNKVLLCGNGGSAADCQHFAAELVSQLSHDIKRPGLPVIALTTDTSFLTAYSNDVGFEGVFERQVLALGNPNDVLIAISTSGNSQNVIKAVVAAKKLGLYTIALTGNAGFLKDLSDMSLEVPSSDTQHIQESHIAIEHLLCHLIEDHLFSQEAVMGNEKNDH